MYKKAKIVIIYLVKGKSGFMMGQRIKEARIKADLTQIKLAEILNVAPAEISQYESDKRKPRWDKFPKLLDVLDVTADELLGREISAISDDENYKVKISKKDLQIISALKQNEKLYKIISLNPSRNIKAINNNIKEVFPE